jgi:hypothetical protein
MKNDVLDNRMNLKNHQVNVPLSKLTSGSIKDKYPVILDGGRTIIFISDKSKEAETRKKFEIRRKRSLQVAPSLPLGPGPIQ